MSGSDFDLDPHGQPPAWLDRSRRMRRTVDELLGTCKGIIFDGVVSESEVTGLHEYLQHHQEIRDTWPANVLARRLERILADGIVEDDEREDLRLLLEQVTGSDAETVVREDRATALPLDDPAPPVRVRGSEFCFTGRFYYGTRKRCEQTVTALGGRAHTGVRKATDYVVIGLLGSRDWVHSTHGTKIQRALALRAKGLPIVIVSEQHWARFL